MILNLEISPEAATFRALRTLNKLSTNIFYKQFSFSYIFSDIFLKELTRVVCERLNGSLIYWSCYTDIYWSCSRILLSLYKILLGQEKYILRERERKEREREKERQKGGRRCIETGTFHKQQTGYTMLGLLL